MVLVLAGRVGRQGPASVGLSVALLAVFAGCAVALTRVRAAALRLLAAVGVLLASSAFGISLVNHYYDYYQSWSALGSDLAADSGASTRVALIPVRHPQVDAPRGAPRAAPGGPGRLVTIPIPGTASGIVGRTALVWLPAQYDDPRYAAVHFPVLELLHGDPGGPRSWLTLDLTAVLDQQAAHATTDALSLRHRAAAPVPLAGRRGLLRRPHDFGDLLLTDRGLTSTTAGDFAELHDALINEAVPPRLHPPGRYTHLHGDRSIGPALPSQQQHHRPQHLPMRRGSGPAQASQDLPLTARQRQRQSRSTHATLPRKT